MKCCTELSWHAALPNLTCLGRFGGDTAEQAVVLLSRAAFPAEHAQDILRSLVGIERLFRNDAYTKACHSSRTQPRRQLRLLALYLHCEVDSAYRLPTYCLNVLQARGSTALPLYNAVNLDIIYPATQKHISKHAAQAHRLVLEEPQLYARATLPFIQALPASRLGWVYNILEKKVRVSRTVQAPSRTAVAHWSVSHNTFETKH